MTAVFDSDHFFFETNKLLPHKRTKFYISSDTRTENERLVIVLIYFTVSCDS